MYVIYILEPFIKYQWKELLNMIPTIPNSQNCQKLTYKVQVLEIRRETVSLHISIIQSCKKGKVFVKLFLT